MLELQSALPGTFGHRFHAAVILISRAVEDDLGDSRRLCAFSDPLTDFGRLFRLFHRLDVEIADRRDGVVLRVVDELRVDVLEGAEDDETRTRPRARHLLADAQMPAITLRGGCL